MTFIIESLVAGFISAVGWWSANDYLIDPYLRTKPKTEQSQPAKEEPKKEQPKEKEDGQCSSLPCETQK